MLLLVVGGGLAIGFGMPRLADEVAQMIEKLPAALERLVRTVNAFIAAQPGMLELVPGRDRTVLDLESLLGQAGSLALALLRGMFTNLSGVVGVVMVPMLAFYLLAEADAVRESAMGFVPGGARPRVDSALRAIDRALRSYVRGQALVCAVMGGAVAVVMALLGLPVPLLLGALAGIAEVVPVLGFWSAAVVIVVAGFGVDPAHALSGFVAYVVINQLLGQFVTPQVMGRHMKMHPFVILVSVLAGATLLGAAGAILAVPLAAAIQSVASEIAPRPGKPRAAAP
jgi:predicted PurR-regulated permease PerM